MIDRRLAARSLLEYACGGTHGRSELDPAYQRVTERRDVGAAMRSYSSCGDLAHWLLYRLGVRLPWINRAEHTGWAVGQNVSLLAVDSESLPCRRTPMQPSLFGTGDVLVIWSLPAGTDAHVLCMLDHEPPHAVTAEYGQPGGAIKTRQLLWQADAQTFAVGSRLIHAWLPLDVVISEAERANLLEAPDWGLVEEVCSGEVLDAIGRTE